MKNFSYKKIAIIAGRDPYMRDDTDGGSVFLEYALRELESLHIETDLYLPLGVAGGLYNESRALSQVSRPAMLRTIYIPVATGTPRDFIQDEDYFLARIERADALAQACTKDMFSKYDLVFVLHVANAFSLVENGILPIERTVLFPMMTSSNYQEFSSVPKTYIEHERKTLERMEHICTPSSDEANRLITELGARATSVFKINRGFDPQDFPVQNHAAPLSTEKLSLLCANGIRPQKDHLFLITVLEELLTKRSSGVHLHLTGNNGRSHNPKYNEYTDLFWKTAKERNLLKHITAHDIVSRTRLVKLMRNSHFAVYPSKSETFGKSALESAVSGLPTVVCDDIPAFLEFIQNGTTGIIAPRIASQFAEALLRASDDSMMYKTISQNGIALRNQFEWSTVTKNLVTALTVRFA